MLIQSLYDNVVFFGGSDFHLEKFVGNKDFDPSQHLPNIIINPRNFNVCLLAGDIVVAKKNHRYSLWFDKFCSLFDLVIYIDGNHESWRGYVGQNTKHLKKKCLHIDNLVFLERETYEFVIGNKSFAIVGTTLWSDLQQNSYELNYSLVNKMITGPTVLDFSNIRTAVRGTYKKMTISDYVILHIKCRNFIKKEALRLANSKSYKILLTHHSPTLKSLLPSDPKCFNAFDATNLEDIINIGGFNLVFHGHIHRKTPLISSIGDTKLLSNPSSFGYNNECKLMILDTIKIK